MAHVQINLNEATNLRFLFAFFVLGLNQMFVVTEMVFQCKGCLCGWSVVCSGLRLRYNTELWWIALCVF